MGDYFEFPGSVYFLVFYNSKHFKVFHKDGPFKKSVQCHVDGMKRNSSTILEYSELSLALYRHF